MKKSIFISTYAAFAKEGQPLYGTGSYLEEYLRKEKIDYVITKFSYFGNTSSLIEKFKKNKLDIRNITYPRTIEPLRCFYEFPIVYKTFVHEQSKEIIFVGINPVNALYGILLKKLGKVRTVIFYTADYAIKRFDNVLLNWIYHTLDRIVIKNVDQVWNVSLRICEVRKKQGIIDEKNILIPNAPAFTSVKRLPINKINKHELVVVSSSSIAVDFPIAFSAINELKKKYPDIRLKIIGFKNWEKEFGGLINKLKIKDNIIFHGSLPHDELLDSLRHSGLGLALYTNVTSWTYYADSMKVRDYVVCGLPVIITDVIGTSEDIKKYEAGYVISMNKKTLVKTIDEIFSNPKRYEFLRKNAIKLAKDCDIDEMYHKALHKYI